MLVTGGAPAGPRSPRKAHWSPWRGPRLCVARYPGRRCAAARPWVAAVRLHHQRAAPGSPRGDRDCGRVRPRACNYASPPEMRVSCCKIYVVSDFSLQSTSSGDDAVSDPLLERAYFNLLFPVCHSRIRRSLCLQELSKNTYENLAINERSLCSKWSLNTLFYFYSFSY